MRGRYLNLFDPNLSVLNEVTVMPGSRMLLFDLNAAQTRLPKVVAAACHVRDENIRGSTLTFRADGIDGTNATVRVAAEANPRMVLIGSREVGSDE